MASHIWIGGTPARAQVDLTTVPTDIEVGQTVNFTIGNKTEPVVLAGTTLAEVVAELVAAWNALTTPEFEEITAAIGSTAGTFTLTSDTAGKPFAVTVSIGSGSNEVQVVTLGGTAATGGTFTLTFNGETTTTIAYNASAATVQSALEGLASYTTGDFAVTGDDGGPWTVAFTGTLAGTNVSLMTIDVSSLTGAVNEIQTISSPNNPTGGTFTLSFAGETTGNIAYNASAATIEAALEALTTIPAGSVSCGGGALPGSDVTVTFQGSLAAKDVALLEVDSLALTGVSAAAAETTQGGSALAEKTAYYWDFEVWNVAGSGTYTHYDVINGNLPGNPDGQITSPNATAIEKGGIIGYGAYLPGGTAVDLQMYYADVGQYDEDEAFSVSLFFKPLSYYTGDSSLLSKGADSFTTGTSDWGLSFDSGTGLFTFIRKKSGGYHSVTGTTPVSVNNWSHVLCVYDPDNTTIKISINGAAFDSTTGLSVGTLAASTTLKMRIGGSNAHKGFVDNLGIFGSALSLSEGQSLYNSGSGQDYPFLASGDNEVQTLTITGTPTSGTINVSFQGVGADVAYNASASVFQAALESLSTIGADNVSVTGGPWPGTPLVVEFINDFTVTDVELLELDFSGLVMSVTETTKGVTAPTGSVDTTVTPLTQSTTTANSGPNNWDVAANWNSNTVPVTGDTVYIGDTNVNILYGLDQSDVTLAALIIEQTFTGDIGLPRTNAAGSYPEYRDQYLKIGATLLNIGDKQGDGSERIKINLGSVQSTVLITNSGDSPDGNTPAILLLGTHASNAININRGSLGVAYYPTEVATVATLRQAFFDNAADDTNVYLGSGVSVTDIVKSGGVLDINSATTTFKQTAGTTTIHAGAHAVLNILAGLVNYNSTGTLSAVNLSGDGVLVFDQDARPKDVTIINKFTDDSEIYDESGSITSPVIDLEKCGDLSTLHMGQDFKLTFGATT